MSDQLTTTTENPTTPPTPAEICRVIMDDQLREAARRILQWFRMADPFTHRITWRRVGSLGQIDVADLNVQRSSDCFSLDIQSVAKGFLVSESDIRLAVRVLRHLDQQRSA